MICEECDLEMEYDAEQRRWVCPDCGEEDFDE